MPRECSQVTEQIEVGQRSLDRLPFLLMASRLVGAVSASYELVTSAEIHAISEIQFRGKEIETTPSKRVSVKDALPSPLVIELLEALQSVTIPLCKSQPIVQISPDVTLFVNGTSYNATWRAIPDQGEDFKFSYPTANPKTVSGADNLAVTILHILSDTIEFFNADGDQLDILGLRSHQSSDILKFDDPSETVNILGNRENGKFGTGIYQPLHTVASTEPTIITLARLWGIVQNLQTTPTDRAIDGFQLSDPRDWVMSSHCHPSEIYEHLARVCNVACNFCYLFGNPDGLAVGRSKKVVSKNELDTRIKYYDPKLGRSLFKSQWEINEFLVDPKLPSVLSTLRSRTRTPFYFITNGSPLTDKVIATLEANKPVQVIVSVNTFDTDLRHVTMKETEKQTRTAHQCMQKLEEAQINYGVSMVAFPDFSKGDLRNSILSLNDYSPAFLRMNLPGWTRYHPENYDFNVEEYWSAIVDFIADIRKSVDFPIVTIPSAFEISKTYKNPNSPLVLGTIKGSPARLSGLLADDEIIAINDIKLDDRSSVMSVLGLLPEDQSTKFTVVRDDRVLDLFTPTGVSTIYPYCGKMYGKYVFPLGIVMAPSLSAFDIRKMFQTIREHKLKKVAVFTSPLMSEIASSTVLQHKDYPSDIEVDFITVSNSFLGGNISVLDMATVGDICTSFQQHLQTHAKPEAIFLPMSGFNEVGRDLAGQHWKDVVSLIRTKVFPLGETTRFVF